MAIKIEVRDGTPAGPGGPGAGWSRRGVIAVAVIALVAVGALVATLVGGGWGRSGGPGGGAAASTARAATPGRDGGATPTATATARASDLRAGLPTVTPRPVTAAVGYRPVPAGSAAVFAPVTKAAGGLVVSSSLSRVTVGGAAVGTVAVYATRPGLGRSSIFQDQYVVQLMQAVTKQATPPRFVRLDGRVVALSTGAVAVAGWFEGDRVILVHRDGSTPDLPGLALGVLRNPTGR